MKYLLLFLLLPLFQCAPASNNEAIGQVVSVADGDTFTLLMKGNQQVKVRLYGIDCPERSQDFGTAARQKLRELTTGHTIRIEEKDKDRYGRIVAIAYTNNDLSINEEMLRSGFAWHYTQYDKNEAWSALEREARRQKKGLWVQRNATPPWHFRKAKRQKNKNPQL